MDSVHKKSISELFAELDTSHHGLNDVQIAERQAQGKNRITEKKKKPLILRFGKHLINQFAILLWVGALLSFFGEYFSPGEGMLSIGIALLAVVFLNAMFTFWQEAKVENAMAAFKNMIPPKARVVRSGKEIEIFAEDLVPGDLLILSEGDKIPADARLIEINALKVNNASLTGESEPQLRSLEPTSNNPLDSRNMIFSGTLVSAGSGKAIIIAIGDNTVLGKIARTTIDTKDVDSPLKKEIAHFIKIISSIAISLGILFFIVGFFIGNPFWGNLIFAIGIIVANVPEGLLPTVTLALSLASQKMAKKNALIKTLESVETLGSTTVICTDKTGTLTQNEMTVTNLFIGLKDYVDWKEINEKDFNRAVRISVLCNNASISKYKNQDVLIGDPTETALLQFANDYKGSNVDWLRQDWQRTLEIPFSSETKEMITVHNNSGRLVAYRKGAAEVIINNCDKISINGRIKTFTNEHKELIKKQNIYYANSGKRVLGLAYKHISTEREHNQKNYVFIGLAAMYDPPRPEVKAAVKTCKDAGIKIIVISGDHPLTVGAIAKEVGIVNNPVLITGDQLNEMSHTALKELLVKDQLIFARTSPQDKMRIVSALQELDNIVAVTGDGVNDAPALKKADIGVAMGVSGTDVAKEAADMILMDDNFSTIVSAVEEGRVIFSNIKKFIAYILTSNIPEILPFIAFVLLGIPLPLTVVLILAIDLGTDLLPALGLATETAENDVMKQKPRNRKERLLSNNLLFMSYGIIGMIQAAAGFTAYFYVLFKNGWQWGQELAFNNPVYQQAIGAFFFSIIICQIADVLICKTRRQSLFTKGINKLMTLGIIVELLIGFIILYTSVGNAIFNTAPITWQALLMGIPFAIFIIVFDEIRKYLVRHNNAFVKKYLVW